MNQKARRERLMPVMNGLRTPRYIRCYDNAGTNQATLDHYTVVFSGVHGDGWSISANGNPTHPQHGICMHSQNIHPMAKRGTPIDRPTYGHLGRKIKFSALPKVLRDIVINDYRDLWGITP